jgi:uncharacterized membrane protein
MKPLRTLCCGLCTFALLWGNGSIEAATFTPVGDLPGGDFDSVTTDVSDDGMTVVGFSMSDLGTESFRWTPDGGLLALSSFTGEAVPTIARAVSDSGSIAGQLGFTEEQCTVDAENIPEAAVWTESFGFLPIGGSASYAHDLSADGTAVTGTTCEFFVDQTTGEPFEVERPYHWTETGGLFVLGHRGEGFGISADGNVIAGYGPLRNDDGSFSNQAFRWTPGLTPPDVAEVLGFIGTSELPSVSEAYDISANGEVIVGAYIRNEEGAIVEGFRWTEQNGFEGLGHLADFPSFVFDVSDDGNVIVGEQWLSESGILDGDFNDNFSVEQGDLDLVLLNWGEDGTTPPDGWTKDLPSGNIDQAELDGVLLNWGESGPNIDATIWDPVNGLRNLKTVLVEELDLGEDLEGWSLIRGNGISADGLTIVGFGINPEGNQEGFVVTLDPPVMTAASTSAAVPEPTTLFAVLIGGIAAVTYRYTSRTRQRLCDMN